MKEDSYKAQKQRLEKVEEILLKYNDYELFEPRLVHELTTTPLFRHLHPITFKLYVFMASTAIRTPEGFIISLCDYQKLAYYALIDEIFVSAVLDDMIQKEIVKLTYDADRKPMLLFGEWDQDENGYMEDTWYITQKAREYLLETEEEWSDRIQKGDWEAFD